MGSLGGASLVWRIALRELWFGRSRLLLAVLVIGVTVAGGVAVDTLARSAQMTDARYATWSLGDTADARLQWFGTGVAQQSPRGDVGLGGGDDLPIGEVERLLAGLLPPDAEAVPIRSGAIALRSQDSLTDWVSAFEGEVTAPGAAGLVELWEGVLPAAAGQVSLSRELADRLDLAVGDVLEARADEREDFTRLDVAGIHENNPLGPDVVLAAGSLLAEPVTALDGAATLWFVTGADMSWDRVLAGNDLGFITISRQVVLEPPPSSQVPILEGAAPEDATRAGVAVLVAAAVIVGGTLVVLLIAPVFAIGARRARRDYALLRAQGAAARHIRNVMLRSSAFTGLVAAFIGVAVGLLAAAAVVVIAQRSGSTAYPDLRLPWPDAAAFLAAGTGIALVAAWAPARAAMREDPVSAMRTSEQAAPAPRRRALRLVLLLAGAAAALVAALFTGDRWLLLPAGVLVAAAVVAALPLALPPLGRLSRRMPVAERVGVREAARRPGRTVPAVTGVAAALALAICLSVVTSTQYATAASRWALRAESGTLLIYDGFYTAASGSENPFVDSTQIAGAGEESTIDDAALERLHGTIARYVPGTELIEVRMLTLSGDPYPRILIPPEKTCPAWADYTEDYNRLTGRAPGTDSPASASSLNCWIDKGITDLNQQPFFSTDDGGNIVVDDGSLVTALGLPGADRAAQALAEGRIVLTRPLEEWPDGTAHLGIMDEDPVAMAQWEQLLEDSGGQGVYENPPDPLELATLVADALVMDWPSAQWQAFVPPSLLTSAPLSEYAPVAERVGLVATGDGPMDVETLDELRNELLGLGVQEVTQARGYANTGLATALTSVTAVAGVIALAATWGTAQLAVTDMRPDLLVLRDVGAAPRTRRRIAASLTLATGLLGTVAGTVSGLALGVAAAASIAGELDVASGAWALTVPWWPVLTVGLGVPLLTAALTWLRESTR